MKMTLLNISKKKVFEVLSFATNGNSNVGFLIDGDTIKKELALRIENLCQIFSEIEEKMELSEFDSFISEPQISDLLSKYMELLLGLNLTKLQQNSIVTENTIVNYLIKVVEQHFKRISENEIVAILRKYFTTIFSVCYSEFPQNCYNEFCKRGEKVEIPTFVIDFISKNDYYEKLNSKIKRSMSYEFLPKNDEFQKTKNDYTKSIQQIYQYGFIYLLGEYKFNDFYVAPILSNGESPMVSVRRMITNYDDASLFRSRWKNIFGTSDIIYIVGGAGYGKSLFLSNIINNYVDLTLNQIEDYLVIYCDLKTFYTNGNPNKKTIPEFLQESMINITGLENISKDFLQYYLKTGRCIVLLDALDEVTKNVRTDLHKKVVAFFNTQHPSNKVCITSRAIGFIPQQNIEVMEILPLTEYDISDYIDRMIDLKKFKKNKKDQFMKQARILIEKDFLNNFLVLSLLVNIYKAEKALPENKIELYKKCFEYIAKKREQENTKTGYDWKLILPLMKDSTFISLSVLSAPNNRDINRNEIEELLLKQYKTKYTDEATAERAINEFLDFCSNRTELFVLSSMDDRFKFFHRSFFEYFYARYINQQADIEKMYELMEAFDVDSEVFELTVALVKEDQEEKYQRLVEYIFEQTKKELSVMKYTAFSILTLSMQVVDDAYYIKKYFELLIEYRDALITPEAKINNKLIFLWTYKVICNNLEYQKTLFEKYYKYYLCYILEMLPNYNEERHKLLCGNPLDVRNSYIEDIEFEIKHFFNYGNTIREIPFFMCLLLDDLKLRELLDSELNSPYEAFQRRLGIHMSKSKRKRIKMGYNKYKKLNDDDKTIVAKMIVDHFTQLLQ